MFIPIDEYMNFLEKTKVTQAQALFMFLIYTNRYDLIEKYSNIYPSDSGLTLGLHMTNNLIENDFINPVLSDDRKIVLSYELLPKFYEYFITENTAWLTLWEEYPDTYEKDGIKKPSKLINFSDVSYKFAYFEGIGRSHVRHLQVLECLKQMKKDSNTTMSIAMFVASKEYDRLIKLNEAKKNKIFIEKSIAN